MMRPAQNPLDIVKIFGPRARDTDGPANADQRASDSLASRLRAVDAPSCWNDPTEDEGVELGPQPSRYAPPETDSSRLASRASADEPEPSFRMSEDALSRLEAGLRAQEKKQPPRVGQSPRVTELDARNETRSMERLSFQPSPPLAPNRSTPELPVKQHFFNLQRLLFLLVSGAVTAGVAYYFSSEGGLRDLASAMVEPLEVTPTLSVVQPAEAKRDAQASPETKIRTDASPQAQAPPQTPMPALKAEEIETTASSPNTIPSSNIMISGETTTSSSSASTRATSGGTHHPRVDRNTSRTKPKVP
jgi:hypothetical protein